MKKLFLIFISFVAIFCSAALILSLVVKPLANVIGFTISTQVSFKLSLLIVGAVSTIYILKALAILFVKTIKDL